MQMRRQNSVLIIIFIFVLGMVAVFIQKSKSDRSDKIARVGIQKIEDEHNSSQEEMGELVSDKPKMLNAEDAKVFAQIGADMLNCFDLHSGQVGSELTPTGEGLVDLFKDEFGQPTSQSDQAMNWHFKNHEGIERRLRLEINTLEDGHVEKELKYFAVDKEGLPIPLELPTEKRINPSDEIVNSMLKEGEVFYKEKYSQLKYAGGLKVDYKEKNGKISDFEAQKDGRFYKCEELKGKDSCQCIR